MADRIPPYSEQVEMQVIGACMLDENACKLASRYLTGEMFYLHDNKKIFQAIKSLVKEEKNVDTLMVSHKLDKNKLLEQIGGTFYLHECTSEVSFSANCKYHIEIIVEKFKLRKLIEVCDGLTNGAYAGQQAVDSMLKSANIGFLDLMKVGHYGETLDSFTDVQLRILDKVIANVGKKERTTGITTGDNFLDMIYGGYLNGKLYYYAGRPGMAKTTKMFLDSMRIAKEGHAVAFFSLEMSKEDLVYKAWSGFSEINAKMFLHPEYMDDSSVASIQATIKNLEDVNYYIDDTAKCNTDVLEIKCIEAIEKKKVKYILIDHMQLVQKTRGIPTRESLDNLSKMLKNTAKTYNVPICAISHLNRSCEDMSNIRNLFRPRVSDFKESGAMEEDADGVALAWAPMKYESMLSVKKIVVKGNTLAFVNPDGHELYEIAVKKNRYGKETSGYFYWNKKQQKFTQFILEKNPKKKKKEEEPA